MHKIRSTMGKRDEKYKLMGEIEIDDAFFTTVDDAVKVDDEQLKRGRGSQKKSQVMVMVESTPAIKEEKIAKYGKDTKHRPSRKMGFIKMVIMDDLSSEGINYEVKKRSMKAQTLLPMVVGKVMPNCRKLLPSITPKRRRQKWRTKNCLGFTPISEIQSGYLTGSTIPSDAPTCKTT